MSISPTGGTPSLPPELAAKLQQVPPAELQATEENVKAVVQLVQHDLKEAETLVQQYEKDYVEQKVLYVLWLTFRAQFPDLSPQQQEIFVQLYGAAIIHLMPHDIMRITVDNYYYSFVVSFGENDQVYQQFAAAGESAGKKAVAQIEQILLHPAQHGDPASQLDAIQQSVQAAEQSVHVLALKLTYQD